MQSTEVLLFLNVKFHAFVMYINITKSEDIEFGITWLSLSMDFLNAVLHELRIQINFVIIYKRKKNNTAKSK